MYTVAFQSKGYKVVLCSDPSIATQTTEEENPDVILTDIMMEKMHGLDLVRELKHNPHTKSIPVFVMSNLFSGDIQKEALSVGAEAFISKTKTDPNELADLVSKKLHVSH